MTLKHLMTVLPLVAFVAAANVSTALSTPNSGSPYVMTNVPPPTGIAALPERTTRLLLAEEHRPAAAKRSQSAPSPATQEPAQTEQEDNRDLERPQRVSPEASNDLFQLLKQAGPKQTKPK